MAAALLALAYVFRAGDLAGANADLLLLVAAIALVAIEFGWRAGCGAGVLALGLAVAGDSTYSDLRGTDIYLLQGGAFVLVGAVLGRFAEDRRRLDAEVERYYDLSPDMIATAGFDGYFKRLNPAWERVLGIPRAVLLARPFTELVHPEDKEATTCEVTGLSATSADTVSFLNRYRAADGTYRWLQWNAHPDTEQSLIYAMARDVTMQKRAEEALEDQAQQLEQRMEVRTRELDQARRETLRRLALAAEYRDDETHEHTTRVGCTAALLARELGAGDEFVALVREAAPLHDVGKLCVSDTILLKPGRLEEDERAVMGSHTEIGVRILSGSDFPVLKLAEEIALTHHERWDGSGYPRGLAGEEIPLSGRIVALADVFDALTHARPYKEAWPLEDAMQEIRHCSGTHFDPQVVEAFERLHPASVLTLA